jgi:hypothetical protein
MWPLAIARCRGRLELLAKQTGFPRECDVRGTQNRAAAGMGRNQTEIYGCPPVEKERQGGVSLAILPRTNSYLMIFFFRYLTYGWHRWVNLCSDESVFLLVESVFYGHGPVLLQYY